MPEIKFRVSSDLLSFYDSVKAKSNALAQSLIGDAEKQKSVAKEQIKLIENEVALLEKKNRLSQHISSLTYKHSTNERLVNIPNRARTIASLIQKNEESYRIDEIDAETYRNREKRLNTLWDRNTPKNIAIDFVEFAKKQQDNFTEQKLQSKFLRDNIQAVKDAAKDNVQAVKNGDKSIEDILLQAKTPQEQLAAKLAKEELDGKKSKSDNELTKLISGALGVGTITSLISQASKLSQAKSGFDVIAAKEEFQGSLIGGILGTLVGGLIGSAIPGIGTLAGASAGMAGGKEIGHGAGGLTGGFDQRHILAQMDYLDLQNRYRAISGTNEFGVHDLSQYGLSKAELLSSSSEYLRSSASSKNARQLAEESYFAEKGYGIDKGTINSLIDYQRSTNKDDIQIANIIGGVLQKGKGTFFKNDTAFLNEFLSKYSTLTKELLKSTNNVASGTVYDVLSKFNSIGGQFTLTDPRSMGLISTVHSSLVSGGSNDFAKAGNFIALRQANPEMTNLQILEEEQKGVDSERYLSAVLKQIKAQGGDKSIQTFNIANRLGLNGNLAAAESIYNNMDALIDWKMSLKDIRVPTDLSGKAKENTTELQKQQAEFSNDLIFKWDSAVDAMQASFVKAMEVVAGGMKFNVDRNGNVTMQYDPSAARSAQQEKQQRQLKQQQRDNGLNSDNTVNMRSAMNRI